MPLVQLQLGVGSRTLPPWRQRPACTRRGHRICASAGSAKSHRGSGVQCRTAGSATRLPMSVPEKGQGCEIAEGSGRRLSPVAGSGDSLVRGIRHQAARRLCPGLTLGTARSARFATSSGVGSRAKQVKSGSRAPRAFLKCVCSGPVFARCFLSLCSSSSDSLCRSSGRLFCAIAYRSASLPEIHPSPGRG